MADHIETVRRVADLRSGRRGYLSSLENILFYERELRAIAPRGLTASLPQVATAVQLRHLAVARGRPASGTASSSSGLAPVGTALCREEGTALSREEATALSREVKLPTTQRVVELDVGGLDLF